MGAEHRQDPLMKLLAWLGVCGWTLSMVSPGRGEDLSFQWMLQDRPQGAEGEVRLREASWPAAQTALIVCDVWDAHHSIRAVQRMEAFLPRLQELVEEARRRGSVMIHAPSDCMDFYEGHAARQRAHDALVRMDPSRLPSDAADWCLRIPSEEGRVYPVDQSDGGEDDDPVEHAQWVEQLKAAGRPPGTPWKSQHPMIGIDADRDYISSLGDEVAAILEEKGIRHVLLAGVHLNMCVLGRPFGLRRMVLSGRDVALVRDLTDTMYSPTQWPFVSHVQGTDRMVAYVEAAVCPTVTSDQVLGGKPFQFDARWTGDAPKHDLPAGRATEGAEAAAIRWVSVPWPADSPTLTAIQNVPESDGVWWRCVVGLPGPSWDPGDRWGLHLPAPWGDVRVWWNGTPLAPDSTNTTASGTRFFPVPDSLRSGSTAHWLTLRQGPADAARAASAEQAIPVLATETEPVHGFQLRGRWQMRRGDDPAWAIPALPAQFGASADMVFLVPRRTSSR
jgi:nicotinamidase-related amidase